MTPAIHEVIKQTSKAGPDRSGLLRKRLVPLFVFILILISAYALRSYNLQWDMGTHLHPDERFLSQTISNLAPVKSLSEYFDTALSSLNPENRGSTFFVYGDLPIVIIRYVGEWLQQTSYDGITSVGRQLSVITELVTLVLIFFTGRKLHSDCLGLIASAFYALAVLPIQQAHFMTVDTFTTTFGMLAMYIGACILMHDGRKTGYYLLYPLFGIALGMATASKLNAVTLAILLPLIVYARYRKQIKGGEEGEGFWRSFFWMAVAGLVTILSFRFFQPYAFTGPSPLSMQLNPNWLNNMKSLSAQASGLGDSPPAVQWARRPIWFGPVNLSVFGVGLPWALMAFASTIVLAYKSFSEKNYKFLPFMLWGVFYFTWQTVSWTPSMRYYLLIYPLLALFAGWGVLKLWNAKDDLKIAKLSMKAHSWRWVARLVVILSLAGTAAWTYAFTRTYSREFTRVAASKWIYRNLQGGVNLTVDTQSGPVNLPVAFPAFDRLDNGLGHSFVFVSPENGFLNEFKLSSVMDNTNPRDDSWYLLDVNLAGEQQVPLAIGIEAQTPESKTVKEYPEAKSLSFPLNAIPLIKGNTYIFSVKSKDTNSIVTLRDTVSVGIVNQEGQVRNFILPAVSGNLRPDRNIRYALPSPVTGAVTAINFPYLMDVLQVNVPKTLALTLTNSSGEVVNGTVTSEFLFTGEGKGAAATIYLEKPLKVIEGQAISLDFSLADGSGELQIAKPIVLLETQWDDALPTGVANYQPYGDISIFDARYLHLTDNEGDYTIDRILGNTFLADYFFSSSNRTWGTNPRIPERFPISTLFYRELAGCPDDKDTVSCFNDAVPGQLQGRLGFDLIYVGTSYPNIGPLQINDQYAEEAFSVYDHPKTMIFSKNSAYDYDAAKTLFNTIDLSKIARITSKQADTYQAKTTPAQQLQLTAEQLKVQELGGTWSELFDRNSLVNRSEPMAVFVLYAFIMVFGWLNFPLTRLALGGLKDKGFAFNRIISLLLLAYIVFIAGNKGIIVSRNTILIVVISLLIVNALIAAATWRGLRKDLTFHWKQFAVLEMLGLLSFLAFLYVRYLNPDLWHPWKGGEKPMDFSFWNAVIKSSVFPAYNPWFAGDFINYYYYGFVILAMPVKLLGVVPSVAYNIILPIWFSMVFVGSFSIAWNLAKQYFNKINDHKYYGKAFRSGIWSGFLIVVLGNLGAVKLFKNTIEAMGAGGTDLTSVGLIQRIEYFFAGLVKFFNKAPMPLYPGAWYWDPSRSIPGEPITEFPAFTFLYADLHAHLMVMPVVLLAVAWAVSFLYYRRKYGGTVKARVGRVLSIFLLGALSLGSLKPINTWDFYTYPLLAICIVLYTTIKYKPNISDVSKKWLAYLPSVLSVISLAGLMLLAYKPFNDHFFPGYNKIAFWEGQRTPLVSYNWHWGVFVFIISAWLIWEIWRWLHQTRISELKRFKPWKPLLTGLTVFLGLLVVVLVYLKVEAALIALPICAMALFMLLVEGKNDAKMAAYFITGTAFLLTIVVELIWPLGDNGRQNSVFKLYLQAWILMSLVSGPAIEVIRQASKKWKFGWKISYEIVLILLIAGAGFFTVMATVDKTTDRMDRNAPHTLDGMTYMKTSTYIENGTVELKNNQSLPPMELSEDYDAIRWMQENIAGSPVILEGQSYEYRWGNRFTIYTGLPGVVGWNYHQRQQHAILADERVQDRVDEVNRIYESRDLSEVKSFLQKYKVKYIIVGQLEARFYPNGGLAKFPAQDGILWQKVYSQGQTSIYEVLP